MSGFKRKNIESIKEIRESGRETTDLGGEMLDQAENINRVLESIHLLDDEDIVAVSDTKVSYQGSFDGAFSKQVEMVGKRIEKQSERLQLEVGTEQGNVQSSIRSIETAGRISEIGREAADSGRNRLEKSELEYGEMVDEADRIADEMTKEIEQLKKTVNRAFG